MARNINNGPDIENFNVLAMAIFYSDNINIHYDSSDVIFLLTDNT